MTHMDAPDANVPARLAALEEEVAELKAVQDLLLRLLSTTKPLSGVLEYYGATESKQQAMYRLLDELATAIRGPQHVHPTFGMFRARLAGVFPDLRDDRDFMRLVIDTLRIERPAYRDLHAYMIERHWPVWD